MSSHHLRVDGQPEALQNDISILGVGFDAGAPSLRSGDNRVPLPWSPGRAQSSFPQVQHGELQSLETYHPRSQPQANYNLASLAHYGPSGEGDLASNQPLLQPQANYNLASLAHYGPSRSDNNNVTSNEPLLQAEGNYNLASLAHYGASLSDDLEPAEPSLQLDANYDFAGVANCGYLDQEAPTNLVNNQISIAT